MGTVRPYIVQKGANIILERPRMVETIRTKDTCLVREAARTIPGSFSGFSLSLSALLSPRIAPTHLLLCVHEPWLWRNEATIAYASTLPLSTLVY